MADGHLGKCKECTRADVAANYEDKRDQYRAYEKRRQQTATRKARVAVATRKHRELYPLKYKARMAVGNALRDGRLTRQPCTSCGSQERVHAHHADYEKPLDVTWLCGQCHRQLHGIEHPRP